MGRRRWQPREHQAAQAPAAGRRVPAARPRSAQPTASTAAAQTERRKLVLQALFALVSGRAFRAKTPSYLTSARWPQQNPGCTTVDGITGTAPPMRYRAVRRQHGALTGNRTPPAVRFRQPRAQVRSGPGAAVRRRAIPQTSAIATTTAR